MATSKKSASEVTQTASVPEPSAQAPQPAAQTVSETKKSNKTLWIVLGVLFVVLFVIPGTLLAIGGSIIKNKLDDPKAGEKLAESIVSKATDSKVNIDSDNGSVSVTGKDGDNLSIGSSQKMPSDFPKSSIPYISEKEVTFVLTTTSKGKKNWSVTTTVSKSFDEASEYFESNITAPKYDDVSSFGSGDTKVFTGKSTDYSLYVTVSAGKNSDPTSVTYVVAEE